MQLSEGNKKDIITKAAYGVIGVTSVAVFWYIGKKYFEKQRRKEILNRIDYDDAGLAMLKEECGLNDNEREIIRGFTHHIGTAANNQITKKQIVKCFFNLTKKITDVTGNKDIN